MLQTIDIKGIKSLALDSAYIKVHPDGTGAPKKTDSNLSAEVVGGLTTKIHPIIADENLLSAVRIYHRVLRQTILKDKN